MNGLVEGHVSSSVDAAYVKTNSTSTDQFRI